ncbi:MAG: EamA family transporter [Clostridia bacterium]|nr:EamA family transporter [Clostridia bacterium]
MGEKKRSLLEIHLAVLLFGLAGIFGKLILLPSPIIVLGRVFFSSLFLLLIMLVLKIELRLQRKQDYLYFILLGIILAVHWTTFFQSIQVSTVAIGLLTFATFPIFITFLEPYFFKEKILLSDIVLALVTFTGMVLVVDKPELNNYLFQGVLWGLASSFTYAVLSMLNRKYVQDYSSSLIAFYEQSIATLVLIPFLFLYRPVFTVKDVLLIALLGIVFTGIAHTLFIKGLKNVKTRTAGIISGLEPVYGILFAMLIIKEIPTLRELIGGTVILAAALHATLKVK